MGSKKQGPKRVAKAFRLESTRAAALEQLSEILNPRISQTALVEQAMDLLIAHYAKELKGKKRGG